MNSLKIKVVFVHEFPDHLVGQEKSLTERLIGLRKLGVDCEVLLPGKGCLYEYLGKLGFTVHLYALHHLTWKNPFLYLKTLWEVTRLVKANKYSLIHCSGANPNQYCLPAARLNRIPCIIHVNTTLYTKEFLGKCFAKYADKIIAVSEGVKQHLFEDGGIPYNKIERIYNGVECELKSNSIEESIQLKKKFHINGNTKIIGQIGSVLPLKGCDYFIEMAKIVKSKHLRVKFFIVGPLEDEVYVKSLKEKIIELGLSDDVILPGYVENPYAFIDIFDISVLASRAEGLGRVIVESQKIGKPVIGSDILGIREVIEHQQTGLLVPVANSSALAEAVTTLLNDSELSKKLGEEGRKTALYNFNSDRHAELVLGVYQQLLGLE